MSIHLVLTIATPSQSVDVVKSHDDLAVAIQGTAAKLVMNHENLPKSAGTSYGRVAAR